MKGKQLFQVPAGLVRSWFELTPDEQKAALIVLAVFLLGLGVRFWHIQKTGEAGVDKPAEMAKSVK
jgi:hypothetical protein